MRKKITTDVQVLDRAFDLIDIIAESGKDMAVEELVEKSGLNRSTVYRLAEALVAHGYLEKTEQSRYHLGMKAVSLAGCYINNLDLISIAQPCLWDTSYKYGLTCYMAVLSGMDIVYVARADSFRRGSVFMEIGWRIPAYATALGWCLLSQFPVHALESQMEKVLFRPFAQNTVKNYAELSVKLKSVRQDGYAYENSSFQDGSCCVAVPIYNYCGDIVAAISISGPTENFSGGKELEIISYMKELSNTVSRKMGYADN